MSLGSLEQILKSYPEGSSVLMPAGPVSDAFIMSNGTRDLLNGPVGSGKTTAAVRRALRRSVEQPPLLSSGLRLYNLRLYRETYAQLWGSTIKSWLKILDPQRGVGTFTGASPRSARHVIDFEDKWGPIRLEADFLAFGEDADPDDLGGTECTDALLNELPTLREDLFVNIARSVGRYPNRGEIGLNAPDKQHVPYGAIFADCNAPSPLDWVYRDFFGPKRPEGYRLFRQPGGLEPGAENLAAVGRAYYTNMVRDNAHRPWWVRLKIHNEPGFNRDTDVVYPDFIDSRMASMEPLKVFPELPVLVGVDGGNTPAAIFMQEVAGQVRVLAEVALARGDELDLAREMNTIMASPRFLGCEFFVVADPATFAGDDTTGGSWAKRLERAIGVKVVEPSVSNMDTEGRHYPLREAMKRNVAGDKPGFLVDAAACPAFRRGLNGTFHYHTAKGTGDRGRVAKTPDSHVVEAGEYAACSTGVAAARQRKSTRDQELRRKRESARQGGRYSPFQRRV